MSHRDFDAARSERLREKGESPVTFVLGGQRFHAVVEPALGDALALADAPEPGQNHAAALRAILAFIRALVVPEDRARWDRMIRRQRTRRWSRGRPVVSSEEVFELGAWLAMQFTARPTRPPAGPSGGRRPSGASSNRSSSSVEGDASPTSA